MKRLLILSTVSLLLFSQELKSQGYFGESKNTISPTPFPPPHVVTKGDLLKYLSGTTWTWVWKDGKRSTPIKFSDDNSAKTAYWTATFKIKSPTEVELILNDKRIASLKFDESYLTYKGKDFDDAVVIGKRTE